MKLVKLVCKRTVGRRCRLCQMTNGIGQLLAGLLAVPALVLLAVLIVMLFERGGRRY